MRRRFGDHVRQACEGLNEKREGRLDSRKLNEGLGRGAGITRRPNQERENGEAGKREWGSAGPRIGKWSRPERQRK